MKSKKMNKKKNIITIIAVAFLSLALLNGWPYGFFMLLRFVVSISAIYNAWIAYEYKKEKWVWVFGFIAILFNPLIVIHLNRELWLFIDLVVGIFMLISMFIFKVNNEQKE